TMEQLPDRLLGRPTGGGIETPMNALSLEELERQHIERVLASSETLEEAATRLGINPTTLWRKRKRYSLPPVATATPPRRIQRRPHAAMAPGKPSTGSGGAVA